MNTLTINRSPLSGFCAAALNPVRGDLIIVPTCESPNQTPLGVTCLPDSVRFFVLLQRPIIFFDLFLTFS
jgi:hypothetical protein